MTQQEIDNAKRLGNEAYEKHLQELKKMKTPVAESEKIGTIEEMIMKYKSRVAALENTSNVTYPPPRKKSIGRIRFQQLHSSKLQWDILNETT